MNPLNLTVAQIQGYLASKLPKGWFSQTALGTGLIGALLFGWATALFSVMQVAQFVALQIYIQTTSGGFLDLWAYDFFGDSVLRNVGESDVAFRNRVKAYLLAPTVTREAITTLLTNLGFQAPVVRTAFAPGDTAAFSGGFYFGGGGNARFGSMSYPGQIFVEANLPTEAAGGTLPSFSEVYFNTDPAWLTSPPSTLLTLQDLYNVVNFIRAIGIKAWIRQL